MARQFILPLCIVEIDVGLYWVLAGFGCLAGLTTVLFGFGGGFVMVPLLYRTLLASNGAGSAANVAAMQIAVATSTCVMVVSALLATRRHAEAGNLDGRALWPLAGFIGVGACVGAVAAARADGDWVRWAFVGYMVLTIADCLLRRGFLERGGGGGPRPLSPWMATAGGTAIGAIATFLGVGGSVMTVPLMRRHGMTMTRATAMANPLSLPVALVGTATYMAMGAVTAPDLGAGHVGYVDIPAFAVLAGCSLLGIQVGGRWIGRIPDRVHARVYVALLVLVLLGMTVR